MSLTYRADIDGLRALAVIPVVLFHVGVPGFSGGYVGVDLFFVISGYLISSVLLRDFELGNFSIINFYERRIRRIFPALFAILIFVSFASPFFLLPSELRSLPKEILGTLFFVANIVFWRASGYFSGNADEKPLLHMWSLGVEEQFYILAPIVLFIIFRYARPFLKPIVLVLLVLSFGLSVAITPTAPSPAFYLMPTRAWELLAGAMLSFSTPVFRGSVIPNILATLGISLLLAAIFLFDKNTLFPGYMAAIPVIGAVLIIQNGANSIVGRMLSHRIFVGIGLISYSLYLWHWPVVVYFRDLRWLELPAGMFGASLLSIICAWLSWKYIERPFRDRMVWPARKLFSAAAFGAVTVIGLAGFLALMDGWPSRWPNEAVRFDLARQDVSPMRSKCHFGEGVPTPDRFCRLGGENPNVAVWSDSHGVELAYAIARSGMPVMQITYSSCPPARDFLVATRPSCIEHNRETLEFIINNNAIKTVILAANYKGYYGSAPNEFWRSMLITIEDLKNSGKTVVVLQDAPVTGEDIPSLLASGERGTFAQPADDLMQEIASPNAIILPVADWLCPDHKCPLMIDGMPLLFDSGHLSQTAANSVAPKIHDAIDALGAVGNSTR